MRRLAVVAILLVTSCGSFLAQTHTISLAFKTGDTYKYALHVVLDYTVGAQGLSIPLQLDLTAKDTVTVKSVDAGGTADVAVALSDITVKSTINGTTSSTVARNETVELKVSSDGRVTSVNGKAIPNGSMPDFTGTGSSFISAVLPDHAVKVGDTWTKSYDIANTAGSGTVHVATDNNYPRDERVGGVDAAVIESKIKSNFDLTFDTSSLQSALPMLPPSNPTSGTLKNVTVKGTVSSDVTSWIDINGHRIVKTHSKGASDATIDLEMSSGASPGFSGPITLKGTQTVDIDPA